MTSLHAKGPSILRPISIQNINYIEGRFYPINYVNTRNNTANKPKLFQKNTVTNALVKVLIPPALLRLPVAVVVIPLPDRGKQHLFGRLLAYKFYLISTHIRVTILAHCGVYALLPVEELKERLFVLVFIRPFPTPGFNLLQRPY